MIGLRGFDGVPGERGDIGPQGETIPGPLGFKGYPGQVGKQGPHGEAGKPGTDGEAGLDGSRGAKGQRGDAGRALLYGRFIYFTLDGHVCPTA